MLPLTTGFISVLFISTDFVGVLSLWVGDFNWDKLFFDSAVLIAVASFTGVEVFFELFCFDTAASLGVGDFTFEGTFLVSAVLGAIASLLRVGDLESVRVEFLVGAIVLLDFTRGDLVAKCPVPFMTPLSLWFLGDNFASLPLWRSKTNFCPSTGVDGSLGIPIKWLWCWRTGAMVS